MQARVGNVLYPTGDLGRALAFYTEGLGLAVKFADGDRYAALDGGGVTFAIVAGDEAVGGEAVGAEAVGVGPMASFKVSDVDEAVARLASLGATVVRPAERGPHEIRAVLTDPAGNPFVLYASV